MNFPNWFILRFLAELGWPRKQGFLRKRYMVDAILLDSALTQLVRVAMGLGAGRPKLGARLIADLFSSRDWRSQGPGDLFEMIDWSDDLFPSDPGPWLTVAREGPRFFDPDGDSLDATVSTDVMTEPEFGVRIALLCAVGAYYGLTHPQDVEDALDRERNEYNAKMPAWVEAGLDAPEKSPHSTNHEFFESCEDFILAFEAKQRPLAELPAELRSAVELRSRLQP